MDPLLSHPAWPWSTQVSLLPAYWLVCIPGCICVRLELILREPKAWFSLLGPWYKSESVLWNPWNSTEQSSTEILLSDTTLKAHCDLPPFCYPLNCFQKQFPLPVLPRLPVFSWSDAHPHGEVWSRYGLPTALHVCAYVMVPQPFPPPPCSSGVVLNLQQKWEKQNPSVPVQNWAKTTESTVILSELVLGELLLRPGDGKARQLRSGPTSWQPALSLFWG